ncbi:hypothetical protein AVEN_113043-1 [Araneus ventricosus]|uniref:Tc1-like transposase DDE domain-containing protein n=1 Tax=Araneus ventricosus TaxID=182803 RepID=A0A4Y2TQJ8_ARAVE|nr:hypothetical protein AVEN_113043-1 [Araneus ventricosus]
MPCHTFISINEVLASTLIPLTSQPPYSPDMNPYEFLLFPRLKMHFKGRHCGTVSNIEKAVSDQQKAVPVSAFQHSYKESQNLLRRSAAAQDN